MVQFIETLRPVNCIFFIFQGDKLIAFIRPILLLVSASAVGQKDTTAAHRIGVLLRLERGIPTRAKIDEMWRHQGSREIALIAANAGIDLFWGCNNESCASITAALHVAYSCSSTKYLDLDGSFELISDYVTGGLILKNGIMYCSELPGLGLKKR